MVYEHKILDTFVLPWKRENRSLSTNEITEQKLNNFATEGWEVVSSINEFKFLLRRPIRSGAL